MGNVYRCNGPDPDQVKGVRNVQFLDLDLDLITNKQQRTDRRAHVVTEKYKYIFTAAGTMYIYTVSNNYAEDPLRGPLR